MESFRFNAARASIESLTQSGLHEAIYTGPITQKSFDVLRNDVFQTMTCCTACVIRFDRALIVMAEQPPVRDGGVLVEDCAGAIIVRPDQYQFCLDYALRAAKLGLVRTVWLEANARLAYEWALRRSYSHSPKSQH